MSFSSFQQTFWSLYGYYVWDRRQLPWREAQIRHIISRLQNHDARPGQTILDAGCGTGNYTLALAQAGFKVIGLDYAPGMLKRAREKIPPDLAGRMLILQADLNQPLSLPPASQDHIINISVLQVAQDPHFTLSELHRVLKPGGQLLLLHVPRPASHDLPLWQAIRYRLTALDSRQIGPMLLTILKLIGERTNQTRYWTETELKTMLQASHFHLRDYHSGPPIILIAQK